MARANMPRKPREVRGFGSSRIGAVEDVVTTWGRCILLEVVLALALVKSSILRATIRWKRIRLGEEA